MASRFDASIYDDDEYYEEYMRRMRNTPSSAELGYKRPGPMAKIDRALTGKNFAYTIAGLVVVFALVITLWSITRKKH